MSASPLIKILRLLDLLEDGLVLAEPLDERLNLGQRLRVFAVLVGIGLDRRARQERHQLLVVCFDRIQLIEHDS